MKMFRNHWLIMRYKKKLFLLVLFYITIAFCLSIIDVIKDEQKNSTSTTQNPKLKAQSIENSTTLIKTGETKIENIFESLENWKFYNQVKNNGI